MISLFKRLTQRFSYEFSGNHEPVWSGNYKDWDSVLVKTTSYSDDVILKKVMESMIEIRDGRAVYERDGVLFDKPEYPYPLISILQLIARKENELVIIDFGGSLGSTYYQCKKFLEGIAVTWIVIEQPHFVKCGQEHFENNHLKFCYNFEEALQKYPKAKTVLLSGVIQCLDSPYEFVSSVLNMQFKYIVIDRTAFYSLDNTDRITLQKVPKDIYDASYPSWFLNMDKFLKIFKDYDLVDEFDSGFTPPYPFKDGNFGYWRGFFYEKIVVDGET